MISRISLFLFLFLPVLVNAQKQDYLWPTDASTHLTSTFGETRAAHFHSGLDIKTWGQEGYRVFASKDGVVHRVAVSLNGYGKVIYLKHNDGSFTVYAHLQRLNDELQSFVDSLRMLDYSFELDVTIDSLGFEVKQGDVIGFTGSTGVGPPHLHFETRWPDETPFNSLRTNLKVKDTMPPVFSSLLAVPLSKGSLISNTKYPEVVYPQDFSKGVYDFGTIEASGTIGLAVNAYDPADEVTNKYAVYELLLLQGADTLFHEQLDEFKFEEDDLMLNDRLTAYRDYRRTYQTLFKKDGSENPFYLKVEPDTRIQPKDTLTEYTIIAKDYFGNTAEGVLSVKHFAETKFFDYTGFNSKMYQWYWTEDWIGLDGFVWDLETATFGREWAGNLNQRLVWDYIKNTKILFARFSPDQFYRYDTPDQRLTVRFLPNTFFDTLTVAGVHGEMDGKPYINIEPGSIPARKDIEIQYFMGDNYEEGNNYRLFRFDRLRDRIRYVDSKLIGKTVWGYPSDLGEFLVMADNEAPEVETPQLVQTDYGKWFVYVTAADSLTGIDFKNSEIYVNGVRGIVEYDDEEDLLIYYHPSFAPEKETEVRLTVSDKAGNRFSNSYTIYR